MRRFTANNSQNLTFLSPKHDKILTEKVLKSLNFFSLKFHFCDLNRLLFNFFSSLFLIFIAQKSHNFHVSSSRMKKGIESIETTFGNITIFRDEPSSTENSDQDSQRRRSRQQQRQETSESEPANATPPKIIEQKPNEDFLGFDDSAADQKELNYFDQTIVSEYKLNREEANANKTKKASATTSTSREAFGDEMNAVDEFYFSQTSRSASEIDSSRSVTKKDVESIDDMSFIDEMVFGQNVEEAKPLVPRPTSRRKLPEDDLIGSVRGFNRSERKKVETVQTEIPIIRSRNLTENDSNEKNFRVSNQEKSGKRDERLSQHKLLQSEVPDWSRVTVDEAANILKSHVCYYNEERNNLF
jgi:hypothetical protein